MQPVTKDSESDSVNSLSDGSDNKKQNKNSVTKKKKSSKKTSRNKSSTKVDIMQVYYPVNVKPK